LNVVLWSVQIFLALFFIAAGAPKLFSRGLEQWAGFSNVPRAEVIFVGIAEVLGAVALVLPMATGALQWLTPLAALGLGIIVLMASGFHQRANEWLPAIETALWASLAAVVAIGRWELIASVGIPSWTLVAAVSVLVPAVIINLVVLFRTMPNRMTSTAAAG
jgi:uncharacterized membrane protein YphA (DoxX/SURF4 family)